MYPSQSNRYFKNDSESSNDSNAAYLRKDAIPDRSKSDYYCPICDSHMNALQMWETHVNGKRHLKNLKKKPGELPKSVKAIKREDAISHLEKKIENLEEPVVGLDFISEVQRTSPTFASTYTCYLCHGFFSNLDIVDHLLSAKHRSAYLNNVDPAAHAMVEGLRLSKENLDALLYDRAFELEKQYGRGRVEVKVEISKWDRQMPKQAFKRGRGNDSGDDSSSAAKKPFMGETEENVSMQSPFIDFMENVSTYPTDLQIKILKILTEPDIISNQTNSDILNIIAYLTRTVKRLPSHILTPELQEELRKAQPVERGKTSTR